MATWRTYAVLSVVPRAIRKHGFLFLLWVRRDLTSRYAGSFAGLLWAVLQPLFTIAVFYVVFALVLRVRIPELSHETGYFFYLLAGLLPWLSIADGLIRACSSLVAQEQFLSRIAFPIAILPATVVVTSLVPQLVGTAVFIVLLTLAGLLAPLSLLLLPVLLLCQVALTLGASCALAILSVHVKDLIQAVPVILQILFYAAPILYPKHMVPETYHGWLLLNPMTGLIEAYQALWLGLPLSPLSLLALFVWMVVLGGGGWWLFHALKPTLGDYL